MERIKDTIVFTSSSKNYREWRPQACTEACVLLTHRRPPQQRQRLRSTIPVPHSTHMCSLTNVNGILFPLLTGKPCFQAAWSFSLPSFSSAPHLHAHRAAGDASRPSLEIKLPDEKLQYIQRNLSF